MNQAEATEKLVEALKKKQKTKTKFYFSDLVKILDEKPRAAKEFISQMVRDEVLELWSSGSTSMYGLKGLGKQHATEENE
ncbi:MAG: dissimilatory sulfite reductase D family protein [Desulfobacterales bacterium]|nr:dissimilatory sulfite reductase D family protein [Desulfobacterales bacterium]